MILCVTLNPCLDKTLVVPPWGPGDSVRGTSVRQVVGGKGNNVARALKRLGRTARPVTFLGGPTGILCEHLLRHDDQLDPIISPTESTTRTILTVRVDDGPEPTVFFDPDPVIQPAEADDLLRRVERELAEGRVEALALSGSSPGPSTHGVYSDLICLARARRVPIFLDTYGPALDGIWGFWPEAIHINRREAALMLRRQRPTDDDVFALMARWADHGVRCGVVTDGPGDVLARVDDRTYRAQPPAIDAVNSTGSGDCLLAGLIDGWLADRPGDAIVQRAIACGVANALTWDAGNLDREEVERLESETTLEPAQASAPVSTGQARVGGLGRRNVKR